MAAAADAVDILRPACHPDADESAEQQQRDISVASSKGRHSAAVRGLIQLSSCTESQACNLRHLLAGLALVVGARTVDKSSAARTYETTKRVHSAHLFVECWLLL